MKPACLLFTSALLAQGAFAQHDEHGSASGHAGDEAHTVEEHSGDGGHEGAHHGDFHPNFFGVFLGLTDEDRLDGALTIGFEYGRRLNNRWGVGGVLEHVVNDRYEELTVGVAFVSRHWGHWKVYAGPGFEHTEEHDFEFLARVGIERAFIVEDYEVAPQVNIDFVDGETVVVGGVVIGKAW